VTDCDTRLFDQTIRQDRHRNERKKTDRNQKRSYQDRRPGAELRRHEQSDHNLRYLSLLAKLP
jgi:hypothetical protein